MMSLLPLISLLFSLLHGGSSLKMRNFKVPLHVSRGESALLQCQYDLEGENLYSVKWYKGGREFFRYVPNEAPKKLRYDVQGVWVDLEKSTGSTVVLKEVSLATSGRYKCEVLAEAPAFNTLAEHAILTVVDLPKEKPVVEGAREKYKPGDLVSVNCTSAPSKPAAYLTWYINDREAPHTALIPYEPILLRTGLEQSTLGLHFTATYNHFAPGEMSLKCTASIGVMAPQQTHRRSRGRSNDRYRQSPNYIKPALSLHSREHKFGTAAAVSMSKLCVCIVLVTALYR